MLGASEIVECTAGHGAGLQRAMAADAGCVAGRDCVFVQTKARDDIGGGWVGLVQ